MHDLDPSSVFDQLPNAEPLIWVGGLAVAIGGVIAAAFAIYVLLLLPFALAKGEIGQNARTVLRDLLDLFHNLIDCLRHRRGQR